MIREMLAFAKAFNEHKLNSSNYRSLRDGSAPGLVDAWVTLLGTGIDIHIGEVDDAMSDLVHCEAIPDRLGETSLKSRIVLAAKVRLADAIVEAGAPLPAIVDNATGALNGPLSENGNAGNDQDRA